MERDALLSMFPARPPAPCLQLCNPPPHHHLCWSWRSVLALIRFPEARVSSPQFSPALDARRQGWLNCTQ